MKCLTLMPEGYLVLNIVFSGMEYLENKEKAILIYDFIKITVRFSGQQKRMLKVQY